MAIQFKTNPHTFSGSGSIPGTVSFAATVTGATAVLQGINANHGGSDHHIRHFEVEVTNITFAGNSVNYTLSFDIHDDNNHHMQGTVLVSVIAETV